MKPIIITLLVTLVTLFAAEPHKEEKEIPCQITTETVVEEREESDAVEGCPYWQGGCLVAGCNGGKPVPATWRKEITTTKIVRTLAFEWRGKTWSAKDEEIIDHKEKKFVIKETWEEASEESDDDLPASVSVAPPNL